jgi:hypothetical protein
MDIDKFAALSSLIEMARPPSPYRPGAGLDPPYLGDRERELERVRSFLAHPERPRNLIVTGLRGVGKTVLLNRYSVEAEASGWLLVEREYSEADSQPSVFAQAILADLARMTRRLSFSARLGAAAAGLAQGVTEFLGNLSVAYGDLKVSVGTASGHFAHAGRFDDDLLEALLRVGELCRRSEHKGLVLRYDEFHVIRERPGWLTLSALLSATAGAQRRGVPMMLILCGLPQVLENLARSKSYSERMFQIEELGNLRPPEDRAALVDPAVRLGRSFEEDVVETVLEDTGGYPFFIQLYGDALWDGSRRPRISVADLKRLRPEIQHVLDRSFFEARYLRASPQERLLLTQMASQGETTTLVRLLQVSGRRNNQLQPLLGSLVQKGLVHRPARGELAFTAPMFGSFLRRREGLISPGSYRSLSGEGLDDVKGSRRGLDIVPEEHVDLVPPGQRGPELDQPGREV